MASTRATTGNSKPRIFQSIGATPPTTKRKTKAKANTSKRRAPATAGGRVAKKPAGRPRKTGIKDKIEGAILKGEGKVERKPGKKAAGTKKIAGTDGKKKVVKK